jgi:hypothetical protein
MHEQVKVTPFLLDYLLILMGVGGLGNLIPVWGDPNYGPLY